MKLRVGDWVEVRSKDEILMTLDKKGRLEELPFMPQMFQYCGQRFQVYKRAHKTCDWVYTSRSRWLKNGIHLSLRCDGEVYGGCKAGCLIYWKEAWLKAHEELPEPDDVPADKPEPPRRTRDDRRYGRLEIQMEALIRDPQAWEEVVKTMDVSRGGFRFKSRKHYALDWSVEVALPRSTGGANIFSAAKIKFVSDSPGEEEKIYGVAYTPWQDAWSDRW